MQWSKWKLRTKYNKDGSWRICAQHSESCSPLLRAYSSPREKPGNIYYCGHNTANVCTRELVTPDLKSCCSKLPAPLLIGVVFQAFLELRACTNRERDNKEFLFCVRIYVCINIYTYTHTQSERQRESIFRMNKVELNPSIKLSEGPFDVTIANFYYGLCPSSWLDASQIVHRCNINSYKSCRTGSNYWPDLLPWQQLPRGSFSAVSGWGLQIMDVHLSHYQKLLVGNYY